MKKTIILATLLLSLNYYCKAQGDFRKGYYITLTNDSINGLIDYRVGKASYKSCIYLSPTTNKKDTFYPQQIAAYGFIDGAHYTSIKLPISQGGAQVFMEELVNGTMDLFHYNDNYYVQEDSLTLLPPKKSKEIDTKEGTMLKTEWPYVGILNYLLKDCSLSADKIDYDERQLIALIQNYNRCKGQVGITHKTKMPWTKISAQGFSGIDISKLTLDGFSKNTFEKSTSPVFGVSLEISSPRLFDRAYFSVEALYTNKMYQGYIESVNNGISRTDYFIDISFLKFPIGMRYNFFQEAQTPYIKAGFVQYFELSSSLSALTETEANGIVTTRYDELDLNSKNQSGFWLSVGFSKIVYKKWKGFVELRYEIANGFIGKNLANSASSTNCLNVLVGIRL